MNSSPTHLQTTLHSRSGSHTLNVQLAKHFWSRFKGLMLSRALAPDNGLLITDCPSVHTAFMRYAIDVVYLDSNGRVLKCVPSLKPWRGSISQFGRDAQGRKHLRAAHTLELAAGSIERLEIAAGDQLLHPLWQKSVQPQPLPKKSLAGRAQRGSAMIEFVFIGPVITLIGMGILQYGMIFFNKNHMNHASFMAARAGSLANANIGTVTAAYTRALVPLYGGGLDATELAESYARAAADMAGNTKIEILNPTVESFADWNDPALQALLNTGSKRVIPNANQAFKTPEVRSASGQTIQDANMIKLRITQGFEPKIPFMKTIFTKFMQYSDPKNDAFHTQLVSSGRIPVVTNVTMQMQSDAIEGSPISRPGLGNNGSPVDPGFPKTTPTGPPPRCSTAGCTVETPAPSTPTPTPSPADPTDPNGPCANGKCPSCPSG